MRSSDAALVIRAMTHDDVARVVEIHTVAFVGFFLTSLGPKFLRALYRAFVSRREIALVAEAGDRVVGFVTGSARPARFFLALLGTRALTFALSAVPALLRQRRIAFRLARAVLKPKEAARAPGTATLMSIGIDPNTQGLGAGRALVAAFLAEARRQGSTKVDLMTDKWQNDRANAFYRSVGFHVAREVVTPERRVLYEYEIEIGGT